MKIYKIFKNGLNLNGLNLVGYVKMSNEACEDILDTAYEALQLVRYNHSNDTSIDGTQLVTENEQLKDNIPIYNNKM